MEGIQLEPLHVHSYFRCSKEKTETRGMSDLDKYCTIVLDEMTIKTLLQYEPDRHRISGFADCGHFDTTLDLRNQTLADLWSQGIFSNWK